MIQSEALMKAWGRTVRASHVTWWPLTAWPDEPAGQMSVFGSDVIWGRPRVTPSAASRSRPPWAVICFFKELLCEWGTKSHYPGSVWESRLNKKQEAHRHTRTSAQNQLQEWRVTEEIFKLLLQWDILMTNFDVGLRKKVWSSFKGFSLKVLS